MYKRIRIIEMNHKLLAFKKKSVTENTIECRLFIIKLII